MVFSGHPCYTNDLRWSGLLRGDNGRPACDLTRTHTRISFAVKDVSRGAGSHCYLLYDKYLRRYGWASGEQSTITRMGATPTRGRTEVSSMPFVVSVSCLPVYSARGGRDTKLLKQTIPPNASSAWIGTVHSRLGPQPGCASPPEGGGRNAGTGGYTKPPRHLAISEI